MLPVGIHLDWVGEYSELQQANRRLAIIIPLALLLIMGVLYAATLSLVNTLILMAQVPLACLGGVMALVVTGTPFSISAAVGFASVIGVCTLGGVVFISGIRRKEQHCVTMLGAIETGGLAEMRPVVMACAAAGLGLLPAALASGIGVQAQQPLARVVVGGMVTSPLAILFVIPVLASYWLPPPPGASASADTQTT